MFIQSFLEDRTMQVRVGLDIELAKDPHLRGSFVHYDFQKLHYVRNKMTHVSPLYFGALTCNVKRQLHYPKLHIQVEIENTHRRPHLRFRIK